MRPIHRDRCGQGGVVASVDVRAAQRSTLAQSQVPADLDRDTGVVSGDDLHRGTQVGQAA